MPACESDSSIERESPGRRREGETKIYRHGAHREHLREIACREDKSEIRKASRNEENGDLAKRGEGKVWRNNENRVCWPQSLGFVSHSHVTTFFLVIMFSPPSKASLADKHRRWTSVRVHHLRVLTSTPTDRHEKLLVPQCLAAPLPPPRRRHHWPASIWDAALQCRCRREGGSTFNLYEEI